MLNIHMQNKSVAIVRRFWSGTRTGLVPDEDLCGQKGCVLYLTIALIHFCLVKCFTSLVTFEVIAMSLYHTIESFVVAYAPTDVSMAGSDLTLVSGQFQWVMLQSLCLTYHSWEAFTVDERIFLDKCLNDVQICHCCHNRVCVFLERKLDSCHCI